MTLPQENINSLDKISSYIDHAARGYSLHLPDKISCLKTSMKLLELEIAKLDKILLSESAVEISDDQYIAAYDKLGHETFAKMSDEQLIEWGNSPERIRAIKIQSVKFYYMNADTSIKVYKILNSLNSGINKI